MNISIKRQIMLFLVLFLFPITVFSEIDRKEIPIPESYFGMHVHTRGSIERAFAETPFKIFRTWDSSVGWPLIEPENDKWNWELLDRYAELAKKNDKEILLTLGMTPPWAAKNPDAPSPYGDCCSSSPPKDIEDWKDFIRAVAERNEEKYGGVIRYWEIWNEPDNIHGGYSFYSGKIEEMVEMALAAHEVLKEVNPNNLIVSPGITQAGGSFLDGFLKGGGADVIDIIGFHFYWDWHSPKISDLKTTFQIVKKVAADNGVAEKPLWVTETGFGTKHYKKTGDRLAALASTILFPWYYGADACMTYSWNNTLFTWLYDDEKQEPTETHRAYVELHKWLVGSAVTDLTFQNPKIRIFTLERNGKKARLVWRGGGKIKFNVPADWGNEIHLISGTKKTVPANRNIPLGSAPMLICNENFLH